MAPNVDQAARPRRRAPRRASEGRPDPVTRQAPPPGKPGFGRRLLSATLSGTREGLKSLLAGLRVDMCTASERAIERHWAEQKSEGRKGRVWAILPREDAKCEVGVLGAKGRLLGEWALCLIVGKTPMYYRFGSMYAVARLRVVPGEGPQRGPDGNPLAPPFDAVARPLHAESAVHLVYPQQICLTPPEGLTTGPRATHRSDPLVAPASSWHTRRRLAMLRAHPELKDLMSLERKPSYLLWMAGMLLAHMGAAWVCQRGFGLGFLGNAAITFLLAYTVGAFCAFNLQQLTHELIHNVRRVNWAHYALMMANDCLFGAVGPGWTGYYSLLHLQHHQHSGSQEDPDVAFQMNWSSVPNAFSGSAWGRAAWLTVFAYFTKWLMFIGHFFGGCKLNHLMLFWKEVAAMLSLVAASQVLLLTQVGLTGFVYVWLSSGFAIGGMAHPYLGFWIVQHLCAPKTSYQPTVSYRGSWLWHCCNMGALYHVEHHDFPNIPFPALHRVSEIAPEFYDELFAVPSIAGAISEWLQHKGRTKWMDFAGCERYYYSRCMSMDNVLTLGELYGSGRDQD